MKQLGTSGALKNQFYGTFTEYSAFWRRL